MVRNVVGRPIARMRRLRGDPSAAIPAVGILLYVGVLSAGYYYNLTFVQLGLVDLGTRGVGLTHRTVSMVMAALALLTLVVAVVTGVTLDRRGLSTDLRVKLRLLFVIVTGQLGLTVVAPQVGTTSHLLLWVVGCSLTLGVGIPVTFSLMGDLVAVRHRGYVAAAVAGLSFFAAALYPVDWSMESFSPVMAGLMAPAALALGFVAFRPTRLVASLDARSHRIGPGRFCRPTPVRTASFGFWVLVVLMFGAFFVDSLGFLRIIETPLYVYSSWQAPDLETRLFIAVMHLVGAFAAGVLYRNFAVRWLFLWVLGLFAFTHLLYVFHIRTAAGGPPLILPMFYVLAVSFYSTLNFALWPDLSTAETIGTHTAIGVGIAGWLATFLSTALALYSADVGLSLGDHLSYVNALAIVLVVGLVVLLYVRRMVAIARGGVPG